MVCPRHFCRDERNPQRISKRLRLEVDKLNWKGIEFPMKLNKINSFEKLNNISINVYSLDYELNLYPLRISEETSTSVYTYYSFRRKKKGIISL